jgi:hypothetical protein
MRQYVYTDLTRLTCRELWRFSPNVVVFLGLCVRKLLHWRFPVRTAVCHEDTLRLIDAADVPRDAARVLDPLIAECEDLGAKLAFHYTVPAVGPLEGYAAALLAPDRVTYIAVMWSGAQIGRSRSGKRGCVFASQLADGTFLSTTDFPQKFNSPPGFNVRRKPGASPSELAERHRQALAETEGIPVTLDVNKVKESLLEARRRTAEWNISRGIWVCLTEEDVARLGLAQTAAH